ncbi:MAG: EthD family reductase [Deltaproteobacteria bacterium]|nr:EthD family reductase [Deltaproteobacteria bacterium]MBW2535173.1 EthD family reductase [Deltaproteobacteria bacterium]
MIQVYVLYPSGAGNTFDHEYYTNEHFALVGEKLGPMKLRGGSLFKAIAGPDADTNAPFMGGGVLLFDSVDDFQAAFAEHGESIMADVPNFTNTQPTIFVGEITAGA